jgi:hypothetical protein
MTSWDCLLLHVGQCCHVNLLLNWFFLNKFHDQWQCALFYCSLLAAILLRIFFFPNQGMKFIWMNLTVLLVCPTIDCLFTFKKIILWLLMHEFYDKLQGVLLLLTICKKSSSCFSIFSPEKIKFVWNLTVLLDCLNIECLFIFQKLIWWLFLYEFFWQDVPFTTDYTVPSIFSPYFSIFSLRENKICLDEFDSFIGLFEHWMPFHFYINWFDGSFCISFMTRWVFSYWLFLESLLFLFFFHKGIQFIWMNLTVLLGCLNIECLFIFI